MTLTTVTPGFAEPVQDAQRSFRSILEALSMPLRPVALGTLPSSVGALTPAAAAVALSLCDADTPVWLDADLAQDPEVAAWITFHTAAQIVTDPHNALFVFVSSPSAIPAYDSLSVGTDETPHLSATVVVSVAEDTETSGNSLLGTGPGIKDSLVWHHPTLPESFLSERAASQAQFPRGVDYLFATNSTITGLPRTTRLVPAESASAISTTEGAI